MPKYMFEGSYSQSGIAAVMKEGGSARVEAARSLAESVGGTLEWFHFGLGGHDVYAVADLPDSGAAVALAAAQRTTSYRPPGG
jgi:uncharacterized protein with GYD domain